MKNFPKHQIRIIWIALLAFIFNACIKNLDGNPYPVTLLKSAPIIFNANLTYGSMTDQEGNIYKTITIGTQTWTAENLRTTKFRNGETIPEITDNSSWAKLSTAAYCNYNNTKNSDLISIYGRLYNWFAVSDSRKIAPEGWHVPSDAEWGTLTSFLGGDSIAGSKMKEIDTAHWNDTYNVSNESGLTLLPAAGRQAYNYPWDDGSFSEIIGYWSSTEYAAKHSWYRKIDPFSKACYGEYDYKQRGFAVRLVKD